MPFPSAGCRLAAPLVNAATAPQVTLVRMLCLSSRHLFGDAGNLGEHGVRAVYAGNGHGDGDQYIRRQIGEGALIVASLIELAGDLRHQLWRVGHRNPSVIALPIHPARREVCFRRKYS
jgi:hypothetical protein